MLEETGSFSFILFKMASADLGTSGAASDPFVAKLTRAVHEDERHRRKTHRGGLLVPGGPALAEVA